MTTRLRVIMWGSAAMGVALIGLGLMYVMVGLEKADRLGSLVGSLGSVAGLGLAVVSIYIALHPPEIVAYSQLRGEELWNQAADDLAFDVERRWDDESILHDIKDDDCLNIKWNRIDRRHTAAENVARSVDEASWNLADHYPNIIRTFARVNKRQLLIIGAAGSGKTVIAMKLVMQMLAERVSGGRVPVLVPLASWPADLVGFRDWLAVRLAEEHGVLARTVSDGRTVAAELIQAQRIIPVLDGLDELPAELRRTALDRLRNEFGDRSFVLTTQPGSRGEILADAQALLPKIPTIEIQELDTETVRRYLPPDVMNDLHDALGKGFRSTFNTPLMAWIARVTTRIRPVLADRLADADGDARSTRCGDDLSRHLWSRLLPELFNAPLPDTSRHKEPALYDSSSVQRWLGFLACRTTQAVPQIAWWKLHNAIPRWQRGVVFGTSFGTIFGVGALIADGVRLSIAAALMATLLGGTAAGCLGPAGPSYVETRKHFYDRNFAMRYDVGSLTGLSLWVALSVSVGVVHGIGPSITVASVSALALITASLIGLAASTWFDRKQAIARVSTPVSVLSLSCKASLTIGLIFAVPAMFTGLALGGPSVAGGAAIAAFMSGVLINAWGGYVLMLAYLALRRDIPWRLANFLREAHDRGVLKHTGGQYEFRHEELWQRLSVDGAATSVYIGHVWLGKRHSFWARRK